MESTSLNGKEITTFSNKIIVYNLGCEMIYLIHHRLQKIMKTQKRLVQTLKDIAKSLYSDKISRLIETHDRMFTIDGIRNILYNICHSSVIVLDPKNFQKLFQMIVMSIKYQVMNGRNNAGLYHMTLNHIKGVEDLLLHDDGKFHPRMSQLIDEFDKLSKTGYYIIKKKILNLMVNYNHKIGMYMDSGRQSNDGNLIIQPAAVAAWNVEKLGSITVNGQPKGVIGGMTCYKFMKYSVSSLFLWHLIRLILRQTHKLMKEEKETIGEFEYSKLSTSGKNTDYIILDKDYVQNMNEQLSSMLTGQKFREEVKETINIDFEDFVTDS